MSIKTSISEISRLDSLRSSNPESLSATQAEYDKLRLLYMRIQHALVLGDYYIFEAIVRIVTERHPDIGQDLLARIATDSALAPKSESGIYSNRITKILKFVFFNISKEDQKRKISEILAPHIVREIERRKITKNPPPSKKK